jgi:DNA repair protein RecN (Recombination protein N)
MLTALTIKNYAIIDQLHLEFASGLNVLTGETGAGKSILVDALNLLLGSRASGEMIRTGEEEAAVEALFHPQDEQRLNVLREMGLGEADEVLIRRVISRSGKSRSFFNGQLITLHMLQKVGEELINIYGQHEHQDFLDPARHVDILDFAGNLFPLRQAYQEEYRRWTEARSELGDLLAQQKQRSDRLALLNFQTKEIAQVDPKPEEEIEFVSERARLLHAEKLYAIADEGSEILYGETGSVCERLKTTLQRLREGEKIDNALEGLTQRLESALFQLEDVASSLRTYREKIFFDPQRLETVESRLDEYSKLKKKYGPTLEEVLAYKTKIDEELGILENLEGKISELQKVVDLQVDRALASAQGLSNQRKKVGRELSRKVAKELSTLGMKKVSFDVKVETEASGQREAGSRLNERGIDRVEFLISPNPGEELKPLAKIASGGELSRIMLALKRIFAEESKMKTMIFDEVDAGIGGGIAEVVGRKLKDISRQHQVFCITHLAQIASLGDTHFKVSKKVQGGRTFVEVLPLRDKERVEEIARMLGGIKITGKTLDYAREMLQSSIKG